MKRIFPLVVLVLLSACSGPATYATRQDVPAQLSDTQLCLEFANNEKDAGLRAEMAERQLNCASVLNPTEYRLFPERTWRDNVESVTRAAVPANP